MSNTAKPAKVWFQKVLASTGFYVGGKMVEFEPLAQNCGIRGFDPSDPVEGTLIPPLMAASIAQKGGIVHVTEAQADELKKNLPLNPSANKSNGDALRVAGSAWRPKVQQDAAHAKVPAPTPQLDPRPGPPSVAAMKGVEVPIDETAIAELEKEAAAQGLDAPASPKVKTKKLSQLKTKGEKPKASPEPGSEPAAV